MIEVPLYRAAERQILRRNLKRFRGGLVSKAHIPNSGLESNKEEQEQYRAVEGRARGAVEDRREQARHCLPRATTSQQCSAFREGLVLKAYRLLYHLLYPR